MQKTKTNKDPTKLINKLRQQGKIFREKNQLPLE